MRELSTYDVRQPQAVYFGSKAIGGLATLSEEFGLRRILIVTSPSLVSKTSAINEVTEVLGKRVAYVYSSSEEHTPLRTIRDTYRLALDYEIDGIVSVGGGSAIDTGKGTGLALLSGSAKIDEYVGSISTVENMSIRPSRESAGKRVPLLTVPTTLSAAEATRQIGITLEDGTKEQFYHPQIQSRGIILDPALTVETPEELWLSTGIKALDHSIEVAYSKLTNDFAQGVAFNSTRLLYKYLPFSKAEPKNLEYRTRLQTAAWMILTAAVNTTSHVGINHAIVHRLGGYYGIPHGIATCITLPHSMEFNKSAAATELALVARQGLGVVSNDDKQAVDEGIQRIRNLIEKLELPQQLRAYIKDRSSLEKVAPLVLTDTAMAGNPHSSASAADVLEILHKAW